MFSHPYNINVASEQFLQIDFYSSLIKQVGGHFYANIHIAVFPLFVSCQRTKQHHGMHTVVLIKIMTSGFQLFYGLCSVEHHQPLMWIVGCKDTNYFRFGKGNEGKDLVIRKKMTIFAR